MAGAARTLIVGLAGASLVFIAGCETAPAVREYSAHRVGEYKDGQLAPVREYSRQTFYSGPGEGIEQPMLEPDDYTRW